MKDITPLLTKIIIIAVIGFIALAGIITYLGSQGVNDIEVSEEE